MSHVDEGALHAYLDGALDEYPDAEARRIRAHLDGCGQCLDRLAAERSVRERAAAALAATDAPVAMPPLEELRRLARSGDPSRPMRARRRYRIGWAASVILALGAGWALRSTLPRTVDDGRAPAMVASRAESGTSAGSAGATEERAAADATPVPAAQAAAAAPSEGTAVVADGASGRPAPGTAAAAAADLVEPARETSGAMPLEEASRVAEGVLPGETTGSVVLPAEGDALRAGVPRGAATSGAPVVAFEQMVARAEASGAGATSVVAESAAAESAAAESATAASRPPLLPSGGEVERSDENVPEKDAGRQALALRTSAAQPRIGLGPVGIGIAGDSGEPAPARGGSDPGSLVVPGLEVVSIVWREEGVTPAGVRVLQRLDGEQMLELIHLPEGVEPGSVERPGPGVTQLVVPRENGWLVLRAPLDEAALMELLRRLEAAP